MSVARAERIKLTSGFLNTVGAAFIVAGFVGPAVGLSYGFGATTLGPRALLFVAAAWVSAGLGLHCFALALLGRLDR